jgi:hypothetical protein
MFRYGVFMSARIVKGKSLPGIGKSWSYEDHNSVASRATHAVLRILRRRGEVNQRGNLNACNGCPV